MGVDDADVEVGDEEGDGGSFVGSSDADVVEAAVVSEGDGAGFVDVVVAGAPVGSGAVLGWSGFGEAVVGGGGCFAVEAAVGSSVIIFVGEVVEEPLELVDGAGRGLGFEPFFEGLLESLDFAAGGGVVGPGVLLLDSQVGEEGFEGVAAAFPAGVAGGVDHGVVGQHRCGESRGGRRFR